MSLAIVTFKWRPTRPDYRSHFTGEHVNILGRMLRRHVPQKFRFICFTDDTAGIDPRLCDARPLWSDLSQVPNPSSPLGPSCYRRLKMFSRDFGECVGADRILALDLDVVITDTLGPILERPEDFVIWGDTAPPTPYNGSLVLFKAGCRPELWEHFDPETSPKLGRALRYQGSDQAWISAKLGPNEAKFTKNDGVYSFRNHILRDRTGAAPANMRMCIMHGQHDPDGSLAQKYDWVREHYR